MPPTSMPPTAMWPLITSLEVQPGIRVPGNNANEIRYQINTSSVKLIASGLQNVVEVRICWTAIGAGGDPLHFLGIATINGNQASLAWTAPSDFKSITFWPIPVNAAGQAVFGHGITVVESLPSH